MTLCKDCRHYQPGDNAGHDRCAALKRVEPVRGEVRLVFCDIARLDSDICGPDAKLFEVAERQAA